MFKLIKGLFNFCTNYRKVRYSPMKVFSQEEDTDQVSEEEDHNNKDNKQ